MYIFKNKSKRPDVNTSYMLHWKTKDRLSKKLEDQFKIDFENTVISCPINDINDQLEMKSLQ